ncbi:MAG: site-specific DNA-methyltransferase [Candidatus Gracilibacteria bacterium]|nr:site-specific DNA-methyltransferase [Candidatus Gracilibacteria bacterium]
MTTENIENLEEVKKAYYKVKTSTVEHMKELLHNIKGSKHDELQSKIKELESELENLKNTKKYGLVWDTEKEPEQIVLDCQNKLPVLEELKDRKIINDDSGDSNILIQGDNYHALQVLNYTHKEAIDVIYIDPPYNTGNKDFIYNDKYIDKEDTYRHSKRLNFMDKRLRLANNLLKEDGVIFISIDDNEQAQLKLLCDEIFGEGNFIATLPTIMNLKGNNDQFGFAGTHEYTLVYMKNIIKGKINYFKVNEKGLDKWENDEIGLFKKGANLKSTGVNAPRSKRPNLFFPIFINTDTKTAYITDDNKPKLQSDIILLPMTDGNEMSWRWSKTKINNEKHNIILVENKGNYSLYKKQRPEEGEIEPSYKPKSFFYKAEYSSGNGTALLKDIFSNKVFNNPKPLDLIKDFLILGTKKDSMILDFMAGSGTTGHAVLDLNKEDGGNRKFILCTNNENNICEDVTYERIKKVSNGYTNSKGKDIEGLGGNLRYYKTAFVDVDNLKEITDQKKLELTYNAGELLGIKEGIYNELEKNEYWQIFESNKDIVAIYFKESSRKIDEMKNRLIEIQKQKGGKVKWYIYNNPYEKTMFKDIKKLELKDIPDPILKVYREINKV